MMVHQASFMCMQVAAAPPLSPLVYRSTGSWLSIDMLLLMNIACR